MNSVINYIEANIDRSIYRDADGSGFRGIDLPYPYTSPCIKGEGKFYFFFYWDTAFTQRALYHTGRSETARDNIRNMIWLIRRHGYMPNHVGIENRSQPPYLCRMVRDYFAHLGGPEADSSFFKECAEALLTEYNWWMSARLHGSGLNRYGCHETWDGMEAFAHFGRVAAIHPTEGKSPAEKRRIGAHYLAEAESAWDFNPRFDHRCLDFAPCDLNGLLLDYERFFLEHKEQLGRDYRIDWQARIEKRLARMQEYLWNEERGLYLDYDGAHDRSSSVAALTGVQLLLHGVPSEAQAARIVGNLSLFEGTHGLACTEACPHYDRYQWAYPAVWPPMVENAVAGLLRYGYAEDAHRIARKFVDTTDRLFARHGKIFEKTDAESGDLAVAEYDPAPMIGWTAGTYLFCHDLLPENDH